MKLGENIKALRHKYDITQAKLADMLGVTIQTITRWENNKMEIRPRHVDRLCELFPVSYDDITSVTNGLAAQPVGAVVSYGQNIKALREKHGVTQAKLADMLGVTIQTVSSWENGRISIRPRHIDRLCELFSITPDDITSVSNGLAARHLVPAGAMRPQAQTMVDVPLLGSIRAGALMEMIEISDETAQVPESVVERYRDPFCLRVVGCSMDMVIPEGALVLIDPNQKTPCSRHIFAVAVNGDEATLKYVKPIDNGLQLIPNSSDPTFRTVTYKFDDPTTPPVHIIGRAVWVGFPEDYLVKIF